MVEATWMKCDYCFAVDFGPPHGVGNPCPLVVKRDEAYIAKMDAERMAHIRTGQGNVRIVEAMERLVPPEDE